MNKETNNLKKGNKHNPRWWWLVLLGILVAFFVVVANRETTVAPVAVTQPEVVAQEVSLVIKRGDVQSEYSVSELAENTTAFDLFELAGVPVLYDDYSFGKLITTIDGVGSGDNDMFWIYYINGKQATVGADGYVVKMGDEIMWVYEENIYK